MKQLSKPRKMKCLESQMTGFFGGVIDLSGVSIREARRRVLWVREGVTMVCVGLQWLEPEYEVGNGRCVNLTMRFVRVYITTPTLLSQRISCMCCCHRTKMSFSTFYPSQWDFKNADHKLQNLERQFVKSNTHICSMKHPLKPRKSPPGPGIKSRYWPQPVYPETNFDSIWKVEIDRFD